MSLKGYHLPLTPTGTSSLVGTPPWHFTAEFTTVNYQADPDAVRSVLPPPLEPAGDERGCTMFFAEYQCCSADLAELSDPATSQYKECGIMVPAQYRGDPVNFSPFMWTTKDFSVARGHIQGYPKQLGEVELTRVFGLGLPTPALEAGGRFAATVAARNRRVALAHVELTQPAESLPYMFGAPTLGLRLFPSLDPGLPELSELVRVNNCDTQVYDMWEGTASLQFSDDAGPDVSALAPISVERGFRYGLAFTVDGGTVLQRVELDRHAR